jgi:hypothetical protein
MNAHGMSSGSMISEREPIAAARLEVWPYAAARETWHRVIATLPGATLYHDPRWLSLLSRAYGLRLWLVTLERDAEMLAACVLAQSRRPFGSGRFIALPFSDSCPPLAQDDDAMDELLWQMALHEHFGRGCEVRGVNAPQPWLSSNCFAGWTLDLARPIADIERHYQRDVRRKMRRAQEAGVTIESGADAAMVKRFHDLQVETRLRLGLPAQPLRFFMLAHEIFNASGDLEVWIATHRGRDLAGAVLLRHHDCVHYKWGARRLVEPSSANYLLIHTTIAHLAGRARLADLGRCDTRNSGLSRFKRDWGAAPYPLSYSFFPFAPRDLSSEVLSGPRRALSNLWRHLPVPAARILGAALYGYLA